MGIGLNDETRDRCTTVPCSRMFSNSSFRRKASAMVDNSSKPSCLRYGGAGRGGVM